MNTSGIALMLFGVWVLAQLTRGDALARLNITGP